jgi:flavin-binding protein dodecin
MNGGADAGYGGGNTEIQGSSPDSFQAAIEAAIKDNPRTGNHRILKVDRFEVEEGGVVGGTVYRVFLNPQPLPPAEIDSPSG